MLDIVQLKIHLKFLKTPLVFKIINSTFLHYNIKNLLKYEQEMDFLLFGTNRIF